VEISRIFIREGDLSFFVDGGEPQEGHVFLFNDLVLVTKRKKKGFELKGRFDLTETKIVNVSDTESK
jgi:hypothetical protein